MTRTRELTLVLEDMNAVLVMKALYSDVGGRKTQFYSGDGEVNLASLARNILVHEGAPVFVPARNECHLRHALDCSDDGRRERASRAGAETDIREEVANDVDRAPRGRRSNWTPFG